MSTQAVETIPVPFAVANGIKLLDEKKPGWAALVNTDALDLNSDIWCVMGQVFAIEAREHGFEDGYQYANAMFNIDCCAYGLCGTWRKPIWVQEIKARKQAAAQN